MLNIVNNELQFIWLKHVNFPALHCNTLMCIALYSFKAEMRLLGVMDLLCRELLEMLWKVREAFEMHKSTGNLGY